MRIGGHLIAGDRMSFRLSVGILIIVQLCTRVVFAIAAELVEAFRFVRTRSNAFVAPNLRRVICKRRMSKKTGYQCNRKN